MPTLRGRLGLVAAILIDSLGIGLFLPFAVIYATLVAHISLSVTGSILSLAAAMALLAAPRLSPVRWWIIGARSVSSSPEIFCKPWVSLGIA